MKRFFQQILCVTILMGSITGVANADGQESVYQGQSQNVSVAINGQQQNFDQKPVIINDSTFVPMRNIFETLGFKVQWDQLTHSVTAIKDNLEIQLTVGSLLADKNGQTVLLPEEPQIVNSTTMVPIRFISEAIGATVSWNPSTYTVNIINDINDQNKNNKTLTYQQAIDLAYNSSNQLKNAAADVDRAYEVKQNAQDNVPLFVPTGNGNGAADAAISKTVSALQSADIGWEMSKKTYDMTKEIIAYKVKEAYYGILQLQEKKNLEDLAFDNANQQLSLITAKYQNGLVSQYDITQAQANLQSAKDNQAVAAKALDDSYQKLNQLVGLPVDTRKQLVDQPAFTFLDKVDLNAHISQVISDSPGIWLQGQQVDLAQLALKLYTFNDPTNPDPYNAKVIDVQKAQTNANDAKQQLDQAERTLYSSIQQMEDQYASLQESLKNATQNFAVLQARYNVGMAIRSDLTKGQLVVEQIDQQMFDLTVQHDLTIDAFNKPWILAANSTN